MLKKKSLAIYSIFYFLYFIISLLTPHSVAAVCPVCTVAVGAGLGISRALGIDDAVTSVWIGGLILSVSFWFTQWLSKKKPSFSSGYLLPSTVFFTYFLTFLFLYLGKYIGRPQNSIWGIDKIVFGNIVGSIVFWSATKLDKKIRQRHGGQLFIYQKVILPIVGLFIASTIIHFLV